MNASSLTPRIVIIGGGFAGLWCTRALARDDVRITLIDRSNHHLFQPLLYQVATAGLSSPDIAAPLRHILRKQKNVDVRLGEVVGKGKTSHSPTTQRSTSITCSSRAAQRTHISATINGRSTRRV
jgi:NADH:ubiquinone reductase (H+-translocating)